MFANYFNRLAVSVVVLLWALSLIPAVVAETVAETAAKTTAEQLFPDSTKGFFVIHNLKEFGDAWKETQIGKLMNDPIMEAFKKDFREQMSRRMEDRFGFTLDEVSELPSGEVAAGMIAIPDKTPGYVFTMDVADRVEKTRDYLDRLEKKLLTNGVKKNVETYKDREITVFTFPETASKSEATGSTKTAKATKTAKTSKTEAEPVARRACYLLEGNHLLVSDQLHLIQLIFDRLDKKSLAASKNCLADLEDYQHVMKRCHDDLPEGTKPMIRWYIEPLNYGESIRTLMRGPVVEKRRSKPSIFTVLKEQGFDAIRGVGGTVNLKSEDKEVVYRFYVHAKKPYRLAMRMLVFPDSTNFTPPHWMPNDLARCTMLYLDPLAIFDNFGTLFDSLVMQGETGVWKDIIDGLKEDPNGPQIDIREEIIVHLGQRVLGMSKYHLPITPQSESIVIAAELKEGKEPEMIKALHKLFDDDTEMQRSKHRNYTLWHRIPAEDVIQPFSGPTGVPDLVSPTATAAAQPKTDEPEPMFPEGGVTVAKGCLFIGTNIEYLKTILDRLDNETESMKNSIAEQDEYKEVNTVFANMGLTEKPHFLQFFARTDETIRPTYELIRQGKMPQSQAILGKVINALFVPEDEENPEPRRQAIDGRHLPEFDKVRDHFGPAGIFAVSEEDGYFFKGFLFEKKGAEAISPGSEPEEPKKVEELEKKETEKKETEPAVNEKAEPVVKEKVAEPTEPEKVEPKKEEPKKLVFKAKEEKKDEPEAKEEKKEEEK